MPIFLESTAASIPDDTGEIVTDLTLALDAHDARPQALELAQDFLVATVQVIDVVERGGPIGTERRHHKGRAGSDVGDGDRAAVERAGPRHDGAAALDVDVGPELTQLWHVLKA